jgi:competence protein ComEA
MQIAELRWASMARPRSGVYPVALLAALSLGAGRARALAAEPDPPRGPVASAAATGAAAAGALPAPSAKPADGAGGATTDHAAGTGRAKVRRKHGKPKLAGVLNVNRASEAELRLLPGIGKTRAAQIVARRAKRPYASLEDLARLRGLRKLVQRLRAHLTVSGDTTLRPVEP